MKQIPEVKFDACLACPGRNKCTRPANVKAVQGENGYLLKVLKPFVVNATPQQIEAAVDLLASSIERAQFAAMLGTTKVDITAFQKVCDSYAYMFEWRMIQFDPTEPAVINWKKMYNDHPDAYQHTLDLISGKTFDELAASLPWPEPWAGEIAALN